MPRIILYALTILLLATLADSAEARPHLPAKAWNGVKAAGRFIQNHRPRPVQRLRGCR